MTIEITAAQVRQMAGQCRYHKSNLWLKVQGHEDWPENPLANWTCPGFSHDPDVQLSRAEFTALVSTKGRQTPDYRQRADENLAGLRELEARCRDSWLFTVPDRN